MYVFVWLKIIIFELRNILIFIVFFCRDVVDIVERDVLLFYLSNFSGSSEYEERMEYFYDDLLVFIYWWGLCRGLIIKKVVDILLNLCCECVVCVVFIVVFMNFVFVVDILVFYVKYYKNVLVDDFGVWNLIGMK